MYKIFIKIILLLFFICSISYSQAKVIYYQGSEVEVTVSGSMYYQDANSSLDDPLAGIVIWYVSNGEDGSSCEAKVLKGTTYYKKYPDSFSFTSNSGTNSLYVFAISDRKADPSIRFTGYYNVEVNGKTYKIDERNVIYFLEQ